MSNNLREYKRADGEHVRLFIQGDRYGIAENDMLHSYHHDVEAANNAYEDLLVSKYGCEWVQGADRVHLLEHGNLALLSVQLANAANVQEGLASNPHFGSW